jgi:hypothetical protein
MSIPYTITFIKAGQIITNVSGAIAGEDVPSELEIISEYYKSDTLGVKAAGVSDADRFDIQIGNNIYNYTRP